VHDWDAGQAMLDRWIDLEMHVKWSVDSNGLVEFWMNGARLLSEHIPTIFKGKYVYLKQGNYRHPYAETSSLLIDETILASTQDELRRCRANAVQSTPP
jgi:hypothetical protein